MDKLLKNRKALLIGLVALVATAVIFLVTNPGLLKRSASETFVLSGHTPKSFLSRAQLVGYSDPNEKIDVLVTLNWRDEAGLKQLIAEQADPSSPQFRKFLTASEFKARFSPDEKDVDKIVDYLKKNGLKILEVTDNRLFVHVEGTVSQFEKAFVVAINKYQLMNEMFFSNDRNPSLPNSFRGTVRSLIGLNNFAKYHSHLKRPAKQPVKEAPVGLTPQNIAKVYSFPNTINAGKYTGKGVTVAIATAGGYDKKDVQHFLEQFGIKRNGSINNISINGKTKELEGETTLDLQQIASQATGSKILMYIGKNAEFPTFTLAFNQIVVDNEADIVSISWGLCEEGTGSVQMDTEHLVFMQGAVQGIAFFSAAGDDGAYDCGEGIDVDYPPSDPYITAVGGTSLTLKPDGSREREEAWTGTGGGTSNKWERPEWQTGNGLPQNKQRNLSDIALVADPYTGYAMYFEKRWEQSGGTSFSTPVCAALWALVLEATGKRLGPASPTLYRLGNSPEYNQVFYDITAGDNGNWRGGGFNSTKGWDHPTGWGVPNGKELLEWVKKDAEHPFVPARTEQTKPPDPPAPQEENGQ